MPVELRSDTFTLPTDAMIKAMSEAALGDDVYREDPTVRALEERAAALLGKEASCFMPSGTMANLVAILTHCPRGTKVVVGARSDIYLCEAGGASVCGGISYHPLPNQPDGTLSLSDIRSSVPRDTTDPQFARPTLLCLENSHMRCGGRVLPLDYLPAAADLARSLGMAVHLDGARIFNAAAALDVPPAVLSAPADSIQFCLSKSLAAPVGSMLVGSAAFIDAARRTRKMLGGGMRQAGILAAAALVSLDEMTDRLADDHANARTLAAGLAELPGITLDPGTVDTNIVFFRVGVDPATFLARCARDGVRLSALEFDSPSRIRAVLHHNVTSTDVRRTLDTIRAALAQG
jgi:threonine aldolase